MKIGAQKPNISIFGLEDPDKINLVSNPLKFDFFNFHFIIISTSSVCFQRDINHYMCFGPQCPNKEVWSQSQ